MRVKASGGTTATLLLLRLTGGATSLSTTAIPSPSRKTVLVTGGNKGIGLAICRRLLTHHPDVHVLLGSRDPDRGSDAISDLVRSDPTFADRVECLEIDTSSDASVDSAAASVAAAATTDTERRPLYGIVNNAGIIGKGFDDTLEVNYFGPRRVNDAFGPNLLRPGGRIVNIASASGPMFVSSLRIPSLREKLSNPCTAAAETIEEEEEGEGGRAIISELDEIARSYYGMADYGGEAYGLSKALLNAYTALHGRDSYPDIIVNSCSPGFIKTDLTVKAGLGATSSPEKGAFAPVELLMSPEFGGEGGRLAGRYYGSDAVRSPLDRYRGPGDPPYEGP